MRKKEERKREKRGVRNHWCFTFFNLILIHITFALCCITYSLMISTFYFRLKSFFQILDPYIQLPALCLLWHVHVESHTLAPKTKSWIFLPKPCGLHCQWRMHHSSVKIIQGKSLCWRGKILHAFFSFPSFFLFLFSFFSLFLCQ